MSVFRVQLNNNDQGLLDRNPSTASADDLGDQFATSLQRSVYVMGPGKINRLLADGETFTDCNYWKRFAYPQVSLSEAFIYVVTDDGSVYSDIAAENTYPRSWSLTCLAGTTYTDTANIADILGDTSGYAVFCQITNSSASDDVTIKLNGDSDATFTLEKATSQVFNAGDLNISHVAVDNSVSGTGTVVVEVLVSVRSVCNS